MSFLVGEDDPQATLEVALALIDACNDSASTSISSCSSEQLFGSSTDTHDNALLVSVDVFNPALCTQSLIQPKKQQQSCVTDSGGGVQRSKKAKSNASAVTRHRERKKAETIFLRNEVVELEATLARLQSVRAKGGSALHAASANDTEEDSKHAVIKPKQVSLWLDIAAMQARERYKSENLNTRLKDAVEKQMKISKTLEGILNKKSALYGLDLLLDEQKQLLYNDCVITQGNMVFANLRTALQQMYFAADALFDAHSWETSCGAVDSVSSSMQVKEDPHTGSYVEVRTSTSLGCAFQTAGDMTWSRISHQKADPKNTRYRMEKRHLSPSSFQKNYTMVIDGPEGEPLELRGVSYVERFDEATRALSMWHTQLLSPNDGPRFIEKGWAVAASNQSNVDTNPHQQQQSSVFRTVYQVSCDSRGDPRTTNDPRTSSLIECVLRTLSSKTRSMQQQMQNAMSDKFAPLPIFQPPPPVQMLA